MPLFSAPVESYSDQYPSILAVAEGLRAPRHVDIDVAAMYPGGVQTGVQTIFPPGIFAYTLGTFPAPNTAIPRGRLLPRAVTGAVANIGATSVTLRNPIGGVFRVGDTISACTGFTAVTGALIGAVALGTVTAITLNAVTNEYDTITFSTALVAALPAGSFIALTTAIPSSSLIGILTPNTALDLRLRANSQFGSFLACIPMNARMPQPFVTSVGVDAQLRAAFPLIIPADVLP